MTASSPPLPRAFLSKRWFIAVTGVIVLMMLGSLYAWSIFIVPLEDEFGWVREQTSVTFSICMSGLCIGSIISGLMLRRYPHRAVILLCALCMGVGYGLASQTSSLLGLYLSYGALMGLGIGLGYNAVITAVMRWFSEKMGFIVGFLMMGFGFGGMMLGTIGSGLLEIMGWRYTFLAVAVVFAALILISSFIITPPRPGDLPASLEAGRKRQGATVPDLTAGQMLRLPEFWIYFIWCTLLSAAGLMVIGHAVPIMRGLGATPALAAFFTGVLSIFNGLGRLGSGIAYDRLGYKRAMWLVTGAIMAVGALLLGALYTGSVALAGAAFVLAGAGYGGVFPINSSFVGNYYGMRHHALNFGIVNLCMMTGASGPYLAGVLQTASGSYFSSVVIIACFGCAALLLTFLVRRPE